MKKVTKKLLLLMVMIMIFATMAITASAKVESGSFGKNKNLNYYIDTDYGELLISGEGDMEFETRYNYTDKKDEVYVPWKSLNSSIKKVSIYSGVTSIDKEAFSGCVNLESVYFGKDIKKMNAYVFRKCKSLVSIDLPESLEGSLVGTFEGCTSLKEVTIPDGIKQLTCTFEDCTSLEYVAIPDSVIGLSYAFRGCSNLKYVKIPNGVTVLYYTFAGCHSLEDITVPNSVTKLEGAFSNCSNLKSITLPVSIKEFRFDDEFYNCPSLTDIYYAGTKKEWKNIKNYRKIATSANIHYEHTHSYSKTEKMQATTTDNGFINYTCSTCGHGKKELIYKINSFSISSDTLIYDKTVKTPTVSAKNIAGQTLVENVDYTVSYAEGRINVGTYSVKVTFIGDYAGEKTFTFVIIPSAPSISSLKYQDGGKVTVSWNKIGEGSGYQLQYATNSKLESPKSVKVKKNSNLSKELTGITQNKMWYVRMRSYKTVSGKTYYSNWSEVDCIAVSTNKVISFDDYWGFESITSKNKNVATVKARSIYPQGIGSTTVNSVLLDGVKCTCYFYSITDDLCIFKGDSKTLPKFNNSSKLTWKSANTSLATVNKQNLKAVKQGNVKVTGKKANVTYTVKVHIYDYKTMNTAVDTYMYEVLKDPDSLKIYRIWRGYDKNGFPVIVWDYGAANGMGGMARSYFMLTYSYELGKFKATGKDYESKPLDKLSSYVKMK